MRRTSLLTPYNRFELRRMLQDGAQLSVSAMRTPASFMETLGDFKWQLSIIVMDGAALYDTKNRQYVDIVSISAERVQKLRAFFPAWHELLRKHPDRRRASHLLYRAKG